MTQQDLLELIESFETPCERCISTGNIVAGPALEPGRFIGYACDECNGTGRKLTEVGKAVGGFFERWERRMGR